MIFAGLSALTVAFHVALILGAQLGHLTMGGRWRGALPPAGRVASGMSALLVGAMAWVVVAGPGWAVWVVVGVMVLSVAMHIATPSQAERRLWLPVVGVMMVAGLTVALGGR